MERGWMKAVELAKNYPDGKIVSFVGKNREQEVQEFREGMLDNIAAIQMKTVSRIPMEPQARRDFALELSKIGPQAEGGLFAPSMESVRRKLLSLVGFTDSVEEETDDEELSQVQATLENDALLQGIWVAVNDFENHPAHITIHQRPVYTADFKGKPVKIQKNLTDHVRAHSDAMLPDDMAAMAAPGPLEGNAPFGAPPPGNAPTGAPPIPAPPPGE
jgi:hypothetical protein